jgi:hypothetical protein
MGCAGIYILYVYVVYWHLILVTVTAIYVSVQDKKTLKIKDGFENCLKECCTLPP